MLAEGDLSKSPQPAAIITALHLIVVLEVVKRTNHLHFNKFFHFDLKKEVGLNGRLAVAKLSIKSDAKILDAPEYRQVMVFWIKRLTLQ